MRIILNQMNGHAPQSWIMLHTEKTSKVHEVGEDASSEHSKGQVTQQMKQHSLQKFTNLLMTFSFDFVSVDEFALFASLLIQSMQHMIQQGYFHDYVYLDQLGIKSDNTIVFTDLHDSFDFNNYLKAPETYVEAVDIHYDGQRKDKKLIYALGILLTEVIAQRYVAVIPPGLSAANYSNFLHRRQRLFKFIRLVAYCRFTRETAELQSKYNAQALLFNEELIHIISLLQQMTHEDPHQRPSIQECRFQFEMLSQNCNKKKFKIQGANLEKHITSIAKYDKKALLTIIKNLVSCIKMEDHQITNNFRDQVVKIKDLYNKAEYANVIYQILELLKKTYIKENDYKFFAYLQQFYIKLFNQQKIFITEHMQYFTEYKVDMDEYFHATNVVAYCMKLQTFESLDSPLQLIQK